MAMTLKLTEVKTDAEFPPLMSALYEAYSNPYNGFISRGLFEIAYDHQRVCRAGTSPFMSSRLSSQTFSLTNYRIP